MKALATATNNALAFEEHKFDVDRLNEVLPSYIMERLQVCPEEILMCDEEALLKKITVKVKGVCAVTDEQLWTIDQLRLSFWSEFDRAMRTNTKMAMANVYSGVTTKAQFEAITNNTVYMAYLATPVKDYMLCVEEARNAGIKRMRHYLSLDAASGPRKTWNVKLMDVQFKIWQTLEERGLGSSIKRVAIEAKQQNLNVHTTPDELAALQNKSPQQVQKELADLEVNLKGANPSIVDVPYTEVKDEK